MKKTAFLIVISIFLNGCFLFEKSKLPPKPEVNDLPDFNDAPAIYDVSENSAQEASGIAPSSIFKNYYWIIEDSGNEAGLHLISNQGKYTSFVNFPGKNRDWEDIASGVGPNPNEQYVYVADIGDNNLLFNEYYIYRIPEPKVGQKDITNFETIKFHYPGKISLNSETLMLEPKTKDLYIISKDDINVKVYRLAYPQSLTTSSEAEFLGSIPYWLITGGDISIDGTEILIKSYVSVLYWKLKPNETIFQALSRTRDIGAPYIQEPQGESICWDRETKGYYTISENLGSTNPQKIYYYSKK